MKVLEKLIQCTFCVLWGLTNKLGFFFFISLEMKYDFTFNYKIWWNKG